MTGRDLAGGRRAPPVLVATAAVLRRRVRLRAIMPAPGPWLRSCIDEEAAHRRLFPWSAVAFGVGILLCFHAGGMPSLWPAIAALLLCAACAIAWRRDHRIVNVFIGLAMVFAGFAAAAARHHAVDAPIVERVIIGQVEGSIENLEERERGMRAVIRVTAIEGLAPEWTPGRVRLTLREGEHLAPGDHIRARARLMPPPEAAWPGGYDFARSAYFQGIGGVGSILGPIRTVEPPAAPGLGDRLRAKIDAARVEATRRIASVIGGQPGAVAAALVTGKRGLISEETNEALRAAGIYHIVSISGLHMVLAAGTIFWLTRAFLALAPPLALGWPLKKIAAIAAIMGALAYCIFSGAQVATVRAVIMTGVMLGAVLFDRPALSMRNLAIAALIVMTLEPETILGPSFQMSFSAVVGLIAGAEWMRMRGGAPRPPADMIGRGLRWMAAGMAGIATTTIIATIATGPFAAYHFQIANPYGLVGNGLALPIVSMIVMPAAVIGMLTYPFGLDAAAWSLMGHAVAQVLAAAAWVEGFAGSNVPVAAFSTGALGLMVIALLAGTLFVSRLRRFAIIPAALGFLAAANPDRPDILVDREGAGAAIRGQDGRLVILGNPGAFVIEQWLKADGDARAADDPSLSDGVSCDALGCVAVLGSDGLGPERFVSLVRERRAFAEDCARATIVITPIAAPAFCAPEILIDRARLHREGAVAIHFGEDGARIESVRRPEETRPWLARNAALHAAERRNALHGDGSDDPPESGDEGPP